MKLAAVKPKFVPIIPEQVEEGTLYICEPHHIAIHRCCCGCGEEVVTPLSPAEWELERRGAMVSLYPSIGNWNFRCQSHYWIRRNRVVWAAVMSPERIAYVQAQDRADRASHIAEVNAVKERAVLTEAAPRRMVWDRLRAWVSSLKSGL